MASRNTTGNSTNSTLSLVERHIAALVTSAMNGSGRHVRQISRQLLELGVHRALVDAIFRTPAWPASDDDRLDAISIFAARLTQAPGSITPPDIEPLRVVGLSDRDIAELVGLVSYYNCLNRVAVGLALR